VKHLIVAAACLLMSFPAMAEQAVVSAVLPKAGKIDKKSTEPPCERQTESFAETLGDQIVTKGVDAMSEAVKQLGLDDPFNKRTRAGATCADVCGTLPVDAEFSARGTITPIDWRGTLPSGLPQTIEPQDATIRGPIIKPAGRVKVICYTFINLSRKEERQVGVEFTY
jgi:hypothetical protein